MRVDPAPHLRRNQTLRGDSMERSGISRTSRTLRCDSYVRQTIPYGVILSEATRGLDFLIGSMADGDLVDIALKTFGQVGEEVWK